MGKTSKEDTTNHGARLALAEKVREHLKAAGLDPEPAVDQYGHAEIGRVDGISVNIQIRDLPGKWNGSGPFARGKLRISVGVSGDKTGYLQRKDGSHDLDRLLVRVREVIAEHNRRKVNRASIDSVEDELAHAPKPKCVERVRVINPKEVSITIVVSPAPAASLLAALAAWEAMQDESAKESAK